MRAPGLPNLYHMIDHLAQGARRSSDGKARLSLATLQIIWGLSSEQMKLFTTCVSRFRDNKSTYSGDLVDYQTLTKVEDFLLDVIEGRTFPTPT